MTDQNKLSKDLSLVVGGSGRKIYDTAQQLVKSGELDPSMALTRSNQFSAPFDYLFIEEGFNIREKLNPERIRFFADTYKAGGYLPALEVIPTNGRFKVMDGHHRYRAAELAISEGAKIARLDLIMFEGDENQAVLRMMNAAEGERLTALDKAGGYKRLLNQGMSLEEIAEARKQSPLQIKKMLMLANAPIAVKNAVRDGQIAPTAAIDILVECEKTGANPSEVLKGAMAHAQQNGKVRATPKSINAATKKPRPLPRKHVESAIGTILGSTFTHQLRSALPSELVAGDAAEIEIKLPAHIGRDLLSALDELEKFKAKVAESEAATKAPGQTENLGEATSAAHSE
jgi:ParB family transcriptional regulator, chromosome partitioning protein